MLADARLRETLRKIEALFVGAGTEGERLAAEAALERIRARLDESGRCSPPIEMQISVPDQWARHLFLALCRRYGMKPYRYPRQRRSTVMGGHRAIFSIRFSGRNFRSCKLNCMRTCTR